MAKKRRTKRGLTRVADQFAMSLIFEATGGKIGRVPQAEESVSAVVNPVSFRDRRALLDSVTKLLAGQPSEVGTEEEDGIDDFRKRLEDDGGTPERGDSDADDAS